MRLKIENIGKVRSADVKLNGLTVIAGENSSGKSTVGKVLFSAIKAVAEARDNDDNNREKAINKMVSSLYMRIKSVAHRFDNPEIDRLFPIPSRQFTKSLMEAEDAGELDSHLAILSEAIKSLEDATPRMKALMLQDLDNISIGVKNKDNRAATIKTIMEYSIESEFMNSICSYGSDKASVYLEEKSEKTFLDLQIEKEKVSSVKVGSGEPLADATYVESPLPDEVLTSMEEIKKINQDIIHGEFVFDSKRRRLVFRQDGNDILPINVASGIKSFGLVQMLLQTNTISANKVLIWDEPENHLHPEWQIAFAKLLVQLSGIGIPVLVSTHSPYFVQGVRFFAAQQDVEKYVSYYLAESGEGNLSELKEVTDDLNAIFVKLSKPLNQIMNVDLARRK